jgi:hypothetical protein
MVKTFEYFNLIFELFFQVGRHLKRNFLNSILAGKVYFSKGALPYYFFKGVLFGIGSFNSFHVLVVAKVSSITVGIKYFL